MARLSISPASVTFSASTRPRVECELNLDASLAGASVTLVVYDADIYFNTPAAKAERTLANPEDQGLALPGFMAASFSLDGRNPPPGNTGTGANPDVKPGTGVLFNVSGVLTVAPNGRLVLVPGTVKQVTGAKASIDLYLRDRTGQRMAIVGAIGHFAQDLPAASDFTLLFRLTMLDPSGGPCPVVAASLGSQGGAVNPTLHVNVPWPAIDSDDLIGGTRVARNFPAPEPRSRTCDPDLTGFYSSVDPPTLVRPLCVAMNQAGSRIAGWITDVPNHFPYPDIEHPHRDLPAPARSRNNQDASIRMAPLVLFAALRGNDGAWSLTWWFPEKVAGAPTKDPDRDFPYALADQEGGFVGRGTLVVVSDPSPSSDAIVVTLQLNTPRGCFGPWNLVRTRTESRWPTELIDAIPQLAGPAAKPVVTPVQGYLLATHRRPLHMSFTTYAAMLLSTTNPTLMGALKRWVENTGALRSMARDDLATELDKLFVIPGGDYDAVIRDIAHPILKAQKPAIGSGDLTLLEWIAQVVTTYWFEIKQTNPTSSDSVLYEMINPPFRRLGIGVNAQFQYTLTFHQVHAKLHWGIGISPILYEATITRQRVVQGAAPVEDTAWGSVKFNGAAVDFAVGASAGWEVGADGALLGKAVFPCPIALSPSDFHLAVVSQVGLIAADVSHQSLLPVGGSAFDAESITLHLTNGLQLTANETTKFDPKANIRITKDWKTRWSLKNLLTKWSVDALVAHTVWTWLVWPTETSPHLPDPDQEGGTKALPRDVLRTTNILFDYDSARLLDRLELELRLAVDRYLFVAGDGRATCAGFASPEGTPDYNEALSRARAWAVDQAVRDAFGGSLKLNELKDFAFGERPALAAGLVDPPGNTTEEKQRILTEQLQWPAWRKVELRVEGVLVARVLGRAAGGPP